MNWNLWLKRIGCGALLFLGGAAVPLIAASPVVNETVAIVDPYTPSQQARVDASGSLQVSVSGGSSGGPVAVTTTEKSSTVATGGTAVTLIATNLTRKGCLIQNPVNATETLFVRFKSAATTDSSNSYGLAAGTSISCNGPGGTINTDAVSVNAATNGHVVVAEEYN